MRLSVIIPAAGASRRYASAPRSKLDEDLGGKTVLQRSVELFNTRPETHQIIVAGPHDDEAMDAFRERHADRLNLLGCSLVRGGAEHRWETVRAALGALDAGATHIAIHDAARPATPPALIDRVIDAASRFDAVIPVVEVRDSLKRVGADPIDPGAASDPVADILGGDDEPPMHEVEGSIERDRLVFVQTPQVFERAMLERAYAQDDLTSTDDAGLVERLDERVVTVRGDERNIKLTRPGDLPVLRAIMGVAAPRERETHKRF